jgi:hypothetical protein
MCSASRVLLGLELVVLSAAISVGAQNAPRPAVAVEPIGTIIEAFADHRVIAMDEGMHGNLEGHRFRLSLIRDPRFAETVNDIVVESGNSRYQAVMDRFIDGEDVDYDELRRAWQDTVQVPPYNSWDVPIYEEFFRAVRELNTTLKPATRLRVLLGDPPIDWATLKDGPEYGALNAQRDAHAAALIEREVLAKGRRALVVYGAFHFLRRNQESAVGRGKAPLGIVSLLEAKGVKVMSIWSTGLQADAIRLDSVQADVASWPAPSIAMMSGTVLGAAPFSTYFRPPPFDFDPFDTKNLGPMQAQFDAVLYLGPTLTIGKIPTSVCEGDSYRTRWTARLAIISPTRPAAESLYALCERPPP